MHYFVVNYDDFRLIGRGEKKPFQVGDRGARTALEFNYTLELNNVPHFSFLPMRLLPLCSVLGHVSFVLAQMVINTPSVRLFGAFIVLFIRVVSALYNARILKSHGPVTHRLV